jgi:hypothetical protein
MKEQLEKALWERVKSTYPSGTSKHTNALLEEDFNDFIEQVVKICTIPPVSVSLPDAEIITWLRNQNYQTEMGEQEYRMYFAVDMPKIIRAAIAHFLSGNER